MKRFIVIIIAALCVLPLCAQTEQSVEYKYVDATKLTVVGKVFNDTPQPFHRLDTKKFKGFNEKEAKLMTYASGIAIAFQSDSPSISIIPKYGEIRLSPATAVMSTRGFDLYIKDTEGKYGAPGRWIYAEAHPGRPDKPATIKDCLDSSMKEFLLYLPTYSEVLGLQIGVEKGYKIKEIPNPFRHRIAIFGSSFTHGASTSRSGMTYPAQLSRMTGLQFLSLGCSGNCKLQQHFAEALAAADVDAIVFDAFSNPSAGMIRESLFPFIETIQKSHPDLPLIFQQTIYRETRNFNASKDAAEAEKMATAEAMMKEAMAKYKNVYFIVPNAASEAHDTSVDGTHPGDYGYWIWAESVRDQIVEILAKYGIQ